MSGRGPLCHKGFRQIPQRGVRFLETPRTVFKTVEGARAPWRVRFPSASAKPLLRKGCGDMPVERNDRLGAFEARSGRDRGAGESLEARWESVEIVFIEVSIEVECHRRRGVTSCRSTALMLALGRDPRGRRGCAPVVDPELLQTRCLDGRHPTCCRNGEDRSGPPSVREDEPVLRDFSEPARRSARKTAS